jgi:molecular chaperone GrpE
MGEEEQHGEPLDSEESASGDMPPPPPEEVDPVAALRLQLEEARRLADTFKDQLLRKAAEFENYKRRVESESAAIMRSANESLLLALLPVVDDFARSMKAGRDQKDYDGFYAGVEMIHTKFLKLLEKYGVVPFTSTGKPFDVGFHDALLQIPRADLEPHTVVEEVERGYLLFDRVLRHAKVIVSTAPDAPEVSNGQA